MATATAASPARAAPTAKPVAKVEVLAAKAAATDAITVADAVDAAVVLTAKVAHNVSVLTQKANPPCRWTPACS
jgi:hypothetical protein